MGSTYLPAGWREARFGDIVKSYLSGGTPSTSESSYWNGDIPWTTSAPISDTDVVLRAGQRFISGSALANSSTNLVPSGSLLLGTRVGVGKAVVNDIDIAISQDLTGAVLKTDLVHAAFIAYFFKSSATQSYLAGRKRGTTIKGVSRFDVDLLPIVLPPLPEQRAIARVLRAVQAAKEARERELALERERKAALMEHLFTHGTRGEATKQTAIGEMPEIWQCVTIGDIANITSGGTPDRGNPLYWNGTIPWVKTGEIDYRVITNTEERITQQGLDNSSAKIVPAGTILMAMYGQGITRGRVAMLGIDAAVNQACAAISPNRTVLTGFLYHFLAHSYDRIRNLGHGANQKNLNSQLIRSIGVAVPPLDEQELIADLLFTFDTKIGELQHEASGLDEVFRALLDELTNGRISVSPAYGLENQSEVVSTK